MANDFIKPEVVVGAVLGALRREIVLPQLVWVDPSLDFVGAKNDTVNLIIPSVTSARKRTMRSGTTRTRDSLAEGKVAIKLDTNLYKDIEITDEELTLDIKDFGAQVLQPITAAMAEGWEEELAETMAGADYGDRVVTWDPDDPHAVMVDAGALLDKGRVPSSGRGLVLGANLAADFLKADIVRRSDAAGAAGANALQDATMMRLAGFTAVKSQALDPDEGYAFHRTAFAASSKVPVVPAGVAWGTSMSSNGLAMRAIRDFDSSADAWVDVLGFDSFVGSSAVLDHGTFDGDGRFVPASDPDPEDGDMVMVRAVKISASGS